MEGQVRAAALLSMVAALALAPLPCRAGQAPGSDAGQGEISLKKTVYTRTFRGKEFEGEERLVGRGDSLWRILVEEKGVPGQKFHSYIILIRGLNPQLKNLDVLRIGDKVFVPLRLEEGVDSAVSPGAPVEPRGPERGVTTEYRVKSGEHLYQILREQLKLTDEKRLAQYFALVKDLNPERKDWNKLLEGEVLRLPTTDRPREAMVREPEKSAAASEGTTIKAAVKSKAVVAQSVPAGRSAEPETQPIVEPKTAPPAPADPRQALAAPAQTHMELFARVVEAVGGEMQEIGEEVVSLRSQTVRLDKSRYPVVYSPAHRQRVVVDPNDQIPPSLRSQLNDPGIRTPVLSMDHGKSLQRAVGELLAGLGYQTLPGDRPVTIHEEGITYEARGDWMALGPEESDKAQEIFVINLTDSPNEIPQYLKAQLAKRGLQLREVVWPPENARSSPETAQQSTPHLLSVNTWPRGKEEIIDALLLSYGIPFGVAETFSVEVRDGLRVDTHTDRVFEFFGNRFALFFRPTDPDVLKALGLQKGLRTEDLNLAALTSRELIAKLLGLLGEQAAYQEHRFPVAHDSGKGRLTVKAWGFRLNNRPMFITDRRIPADLHRFFFEKGLEIVYFQ